MNLKPHEEKWLGRFIARKVAAGTAWAILDMHRAMAAHSIRASNSQVATHEMILKEYDSIVRRLLRQSKLRPSPAGKRARP